VGRAAAARALPLAGLLVLAAGTASAQQGIFDGMQLGVESVFSSVSTKTTFASGEQTKTDITNVFPALTVNINSLVYPNLRLNAGGTFEINWLFSDTNGAETDSTISRNRPFFLLRSTNPVFSPGFGYFRRADRARTGLVSDIKLTNEEYAAYLGWNPAGGPQNEFQFLRTHTFDGARAYQDTVKGFGSLVSNYSYRNLNAYYRGTYLNTDERLLGYETRQLTHAGRVNYSGTHIDKRLIWNATYNINYQDLRTAATSESAEVPIPLTPFAGLAALSDTPVTARLSPAPQLMDGNLAAGAGIDIGLATPPADLQARNIGLDFLNPAQVNRLWIWVDRDLPFEVASSFTWDVYTSPDNIIWRREATVSAAPFGPFENRFEVDFPSVTARYVKVVTRPLSAAVPDASRYPDILVTEMQPFLRRPAGEVGDRLTRTTHLVNADVRMRLLDAPSLYYEGFFLYNGPDTFGNSTDTLSNGLSASHTFARIFSAYGRAAFEQGSDPRGDRTATITNATLTVEPFPTLRSSLLYSGQDEKIGGLPNDRYGFFVQNALQPYRGLDFLVGFGWNFTTRETGERARDRLLNLTATVVPREHVNLTFNYDDTTTTRSGIFVGSPQTHTRRLYAAVGFDPVRTLHLVVGEEVLAVSDQRTRTTLDLGANWSPFADGTLQFIFAYNEAMRALEFGKDRSTVGAVRWNLSPRSYVDVSYQRTRSEFVFQKTESRILSCTLRMFL